MGVAAGVAIGAQVLGGVMQAGQQQQAGQAQALALRQNAFLARIAAGDAIQRGVAESGRVRMQASQMIGQQQVAAGASGVEADPALAGNTRLFAELDAQTIRNNAAREAWGHTRQSLQMQQAALQAQENGANAAYGSLLGTGARAAGGIYAAGRQQGWWGAGPAGGM